MTTKEKVKYMMDTHLVKESPDNTGLIPSKRWYLTDGRKQGINPLRTILNRTFSEDTLKLIQQTKEVDVDFFREHDIGVIEAYNQFYGEENGEQQLAKELKESKGVGKGLQGDGNKSPRSIHISQKQWESYLAKGGERNYVFSCEARPDILIIDFDYKLTDDQFQKIQKAFKKYLWVIEKNMVKGSSHIYIQTDNKELRIDKVKANLKEDKKDDEALDIDIFLNSQKNVSCTTPCRTYRILYDEKPTSSISVRKALTMLSKTLNYHLDKKTLEEMLKPTETYTKQTTTTKTATGEITITSSSYNNERCTTIVENAIPIFTKLGNKGIREELYKNLIGALLTHGFNNNDTTQIITQIYEITEDNKTENQRLVTLKNGLQRYQNGEALGTWSKFQSIVKEHNNRKLQLGSHLQQIGDSIFINKPPMIRTVNPATEQVETAILITDNKEQTFSEYTETAENTDQVYTISNPYNDFKIIVDYKHKNIAKRTFKKDKNGNATKEDVLIITAVPTELVVYNDNICGTGKQYQCQWSFEDGTTTEVTGDITQHTKVLTKGAGVWNKQQLPNVISAVFGDLTKTKEHGTQVLNTPQQKGFYYDKEKEEIITVNHKIIRPTKAQLHTALEVLDIYSQYFGYGYYNPDEPRGVGYEINPKTNEKMPTFKTDSKRLAVFIRWCLNAPFHFVRKQMGLTNDKYIYLTGESGVGKTYGYFMAGLFMLGVEEPKEFLVSGGSNSKAQVSKNLKKTTFPVFFDEGDDILKKDEVKSMLKHAVQGLNSREVTDTDTNELTKDKALAPLGFSSNTQFEDTEKGALTNRVITLSFNINDVPTQLMKEKFEKEFNTGYTPEDKRQVFKWIGYEFQARILENPKCYIAMNPDEVVKDFFKDIAVDGEYPEILEWINEDIDQKTAEDNRNERHTLLKNAIRKILNRHLNFTMIKEDELSLNTKSLIEDERLTWKDRILYLAESRKVSWLNTTKKRDRLIIENGIIQEIRRENPELQINTLEDLNDLLVTARYQSYEVGRYIVNNNGKREDKYNSLRLEVEVISDLYEFED